MHIQTEIKTTFNLNPYKLDVVGSSFAGAELAGSLTESRRSQFVQQMTQESKSTF